MHYKNPQVVCKQSAAPKQRTSFEGWTLAQIREHKEVKVTAAGRRRVFKALRQRLKVRPGIEFPLI